MKQHIATIAVTLHRQTKYITVMHLLRLFMISLSAMMVLSCNGQIKKETAEMKDSKSLVVFFSHTGENYAVGNIKVGNTKIVADRISELTGAHQFEIKTSKYDGMKYKDLVDLATKEKRNNEKPAFEGKVDDISQYDTIFTGGPIWWGTYPQVMFTFFDRYDLNGKTIIPFSTHEGSGLASVVEDLRRIYPNAVIKGAASFYGHEVRQSTGKVDSWIKNLDY